MFSQFYNTGLAFAGYDIDNEPINNSFRQYSLNVVHSLKPNCMEFFICKEFKISSYLRQYLHSLIQDISS